MKKRSFLWIFYFITLLFCYFTALTEAYFENVPEDFRSFSLGGIREIQNPAYPREKKLDLVYNMPYRGIDENFSSYYTGISLPFNGFSLGLSHSQVAFAGVFAEVLTRFSMSFKTARGGAGVTLRKYGIKFSPDDYTSGDSYFSKTTADSAADFDFGLIREIKDLRISLIVVNILASEIGLAEKDKLNREISLGAEKKYGLFGAAGAVFAELANNASDNFEALDYRFGIELFLPQNITARMAANRYYFIPSAEYAYPLNEKYALSAGLAYKYPYGTMGELSELSTIVSVKRVFAAREKTPSQSPPPTAEEVKREEKTPSQSPPPTAEEVGVKSEKKINEADEKIIQIEKGDRFNKAVGFYEKGEYEKAIQEWMKVLELDPEHSESKRLIKKAQEIKEKKLQKGE